MNRKMDAQKKAELTFSAINYNLVWILFESGVQMWIFSCCFSIASSKNLSRPFTKQILWKCGLLKLIFIYLFLEQQACKTTLKANSESKSRQQM